MTTRPRATSSARRLAVVLLGLAVGVGVLPAIASAAPSAGTPVAASAATSSTPSGTAVPKADVLDVDFADGTPVDHAQGLPAQTIKAPVIGTDPTLGRKVAGFDGTSAYAYDLSGAWDATRTPTITGQVTVECQFSLTTVPVTAEQDPCGTKYAGGYGIYVSANSSTLRGAVDIAGSYKSASTTIAANTWYDAVLTYDGSAVTLYLNGQQVSRTATTGAVQVPSVKYFGIGSTIKSATEVSIPATGSVAAGRVWSTPLTADQVGALYQQSGAPTPPPPASGSVPAADVLDVDFAGGAPTDHAQNRTPAVTGTPVYGVDPTINHPVASFDGTTNGVLYPLPDAWDATHTPNITRSVTVECWFRFDGTLPVASENDVCSGKEAGGYTIRVSKDTVQAQFHVGGAYQLATSAPISAGTWYHTVATYDGAAVTLYVNGSAASSVPATGAVGVPTARFFGVGADTSKSAKPETGAKATIADARIWSAALTADQVGTLFRQDTTTSTVPAADVLDVGFADGTYTDRAANRPPAVTGAPVVSTDPALNRPVASFGGNAAVVYPFQDAWDATRTPNILKSATIECDFRFNGTLPAAAESDVCSDKNSGGYSVYVTGSTIRAAFYVDGGYRTVTSPAIEPGVWYAVVATYDGTAIKLYVNGALAASTAVSGAVGAPQADAGYFAIGADVGSKGGKPEFFSVSTVADARVWSTALSAAQVQQLNQQVFGARQVSVTLTSTTPAKDATLTAPVAFRADVTNQGAATRWTYTLDGQPVQLGQTIGAGMKAGTHTIVITAVDLFGHPLSWTVPFTSVTIPTGGGTDVGQKGGTVTLSAIATDPDGGKVTTTFKQATADVANGGTQGTVPVLPSTLDFSYADAGQVTGQQAPDGTFSDSPASHEDIPFQKFDVPVPADGSGRRVQWTGVVDPERSASLLVWDTAARKWQQLATTRGAATGSTTLASPVTAAEVDGGVVHVLVVAQDPFADDLSPRNASAAADADHFDPAGADQFSFVHWTDPQYIAEGAVGGSGQWPASPVYPTKSKVQTEEEQAVWAAAYRDDAQWTKDNAAKYNIAYAANTGDLINNDLVDPQSKDAAGNLLYPGLEDEVAKENAFATDVFSVLGGSGLPNQVVAGNHDDQNGAEQGSGSRFSKAFTAASYYDQARTWPAGASYHTRDETTGANGAVVTRGTDSQDSYVLFSAGGLDFVAVGLSYGVTQDEANWASSVLARYKDRNGILITHGYLAASPNGDGRGAASSSDGDLLYKQVVSANPNVFLVLAGHVHGVGTNLKTIQGPQINHRVVEMLADYQEYSVPASKVFTARNCPTCVVAANGDIDVDGDGVADHAGADKLKFGASFLRLLQFNTEKSTMSVDSYSPFFDEFGTHEYDTNSPARYNGSEDNFTVPVDLSSRTTSFRTDGLTVITPTDTVIGSATGTSGFPVSVTWSGLTAGQTYAWTATSTDGDGDAVGRVDQFGGVFVATPAGTDTTAPVLTFPATTTVQQGDVFDPLAGVSASDDTAGDVTAGIKVVGTVDTSAPGTYTLVYSVADPNGNQAQAVRTVKVVAKPAPVLTTTSVTAKDTSVTFGDTLTLSATVSPADATGTVQFLTGEEVWCTATVSKGVATCTAPQPLQPPGRYSVVAGYSGDSTHKPSSTAFQLTITQPVRTATKITAGPAQTTYGTAGTVAVTVSGGKTSPSGTVTLKDGTTVLGTATLSGGRATVQLPATALSQGAHTLALAYAGDPTHDSSTGSVVVTVLKAATRTGVQVSPAPVTTATKPTVTVTVTGTGVAPAGKVTVAVTGAGSRVVDLVNGSASVQLPALTAGAKAVTVTYDGDRNLAGSTGTASFTVTR